MKTPKILIVDDIVLCINLYRALLSKYNIDILTATNGLEGVETFRNNSDIDLIIMNYRMPIMDGVEATIEIRKFNKDIPIIMTSAYFGVKQDRDEILKCGANDYIRIPIKFPDFIETIEKHLGYKLIMK